MDSDNVVVLGAGLAGSSAALELAERGVQVTLIDQDRVPMNRASLRNEGKIHIGLCYAADSSLKTATMQMDGALKFQSLLRRWIGERADTISLSTPFVYSVARDALREFRACDPVTRCLKEKRSNQLNLSLD